MREWLVPIKITNGSGKIKRRTIRIRADVDEWQAQRLASIKARWNKEYLTVVELWGYPAGLYWRPEFGWQTINHAIDRETMSCNHGCCSLKKAA